MQLDSHDLSSFYEEPIGQVTRRMIVRRMRLLWPDARGQRVLGYGFAMPYVKAFSAEAERIVAIIPSQQGTGPWLEDRCLVASADEDALPVPDSAFDLIVMVHALECAEAVRPLLRQIWRILVPSGRLLLVVPNRASLWAQIERSPFAQGRPFTKGQLDRVMRGAMFMPERWDAALYFPPLRTRRLVRSGGAWERVGRMCWPRLAGVHLLEATKSLYAVAPAGGGRLRKTVFATASK